MSWCAADIMKTCRSYCPDCDLLRDDEKWMWNDAEKEIEAAGIKCKHCNSKNVYYWRFGIINGVKKSRIYGCMDCGEYTIIRVRK